MHDWLLTWAVHAQHHSFDAGVQASLLQGLAQGLAGNLAAPSRLLAAMPLQYGPCMAGTARSALAVGPDEGTHVLCNGETYADATELHESLHSTVTMHTWRLLD